MKKVLETVLSGLLAVVLLSGLFTLHVPARAAFTDLPEGAWYAEAANWCREHGIVNEGAAFSPETVMTRAMVATALYRASGSPAMAAQVEFADVPASSSDAAAVSWATGAGIVNGYGDGIFKPNNLVTRQQFAAMLWRAAGQPAADAGTDYADEAIIASYAKTAVDWARDAGVILGKDGNRFDPQGGVTLAQAAMILYRYLTLDKQSQTSDDTNLSGGWTVNSGELSMSANPNAMAAFEKAVEGLSGYSYEPLVLLGTQIVAGTNYRILCRGSAVVPDPVPTYEIITVYEDLNGNAEITDTTPLPGLPETMENLPGGWTLNDSDVSMDAHSEAQAALDTALEGLAGAGYEATVYLADQIVAGTNYLLFCRVTPVVPNPIPSFEVVTVYADLDGNAEVTNMQSVGF